MNWVNELEGRKIVDIKTKNEIALCNIAAINLHKDFTDEEYVQACYYALRTVDYVIYNSDYTFPNVEYTAESFSYNAIVSWKGLVGRVISAHKFEL